MTAEVSLYLAAGILPNLIFALKNFVFCKSITPYQKKFINPKLLSYVNPYQH
jgi:hypothetical protein